MAADVDSVLEKFYDLYSGAKKRHKDPAILPNARNLKALNESAAGFKSLEVSSAMANKQRYLKYSFIGF